MNPSQPEPVAGEHNPNGLTPEQYGAPEWRLLREGEILTNGDQWFINKEDGWFDIRSFGRTADSFSTVTYRRRVSPAQTGEQTPESAEVKACPSEWIVEPMTEKVAAGLFRDGELVAVGNGEVSNSVFRKIADMMNAESSSLTSLQEENEKYKDCFNEMRDEAVRLRDERDQLRAEVERLTKERDEARERAGDFANRMAAINGQINVMANAVNGQRWDAYWTAEGAIQRLIGGDFDHAVGSNFEAYRRLEAERDSLRAQLAEREEDRWQDIETAPDGETILGYSPDWVQPDYNPKGVRECFFGGQGWQSPEWNNYQDTYEDGSGKPTHWQPLPKPPAIRSARGATPEGTQEGAAGQVATEDDRPAIIKEADAKETGPRFLGLPERWYDEGPKWRCPNGHVSTRYLKSEELGRPACLAGGCRGKLWLTFPEDHDDCAAPDRGAQEEGR